MPTDVTDEDDIDSLVDATTDEYGRIDILVNNAGVMLLEPLERQIARTSGRWSR